MDISFIVPVLNEEKYISNTLSTIINIMDNTTNFTYEIVIIDDNSTDNSVTKIKQYIKTYDNIFLVELTHQYFASAVRNIGASSAVGDVFVFLDGDVTLTKKWATTLKNLYTFIKNEKVITGSVYDVSTNCSKMENLWFKPIVNKQKNYINGGNILVSKTTFNLLKFDNKLETGEDTDFSYRAQQQEFTVVNIPQFQVIHNGFPKTLKNFFQREKWHGKGNFATIKKMLNKISILIICLWILLFYSIITINVWLFPFAFLGISLMFAIQRCGIKNFLKNPFYLITIAGTFITARSLSLINVLTNKIKGKHE